ncbi:MAG TPA: hypothetical protein VHQ89_03000 [Gaiellaceae bacterium]|jgi:hypothetical protein|nr:hypothetical protein [Gaiellaceae bacterium]
MRALVAVLLLAAALPSAVGASAQRGFAFGRTGGNILPFTVSIENNGSVHVTGPVAVMRKKLTRLEVADLNRVVATNGFERLRPMNQCPDALPDVASTFVRVGPLRVQVHGSCLARYQHVYNALAKAVRLKYA